MPAATQKDISTLEDRIKELRDAYEERVKANDDIVNAVETKDGVLVIDAEKREAFQKNLTDLKEMRETIAALEEQKNAALWGSQPADPSAAIAAAAAATLNGGHARLGPLNGKTLGEAFVESDEFKALQGGRAGVTMPVPWAVKMADVASLWVPPTARKDIYSDLPSGTPGRFGSVQRDPIVGTAQRRTRVRDLFPVQRTTAAVIEYFRVEGFVGDVGSIPGDNTGNLAATVAERDGSAFAAKPHTELNISGQQATVRTIAHWEAAHRNVLQDEPQLQGIIENELLYGLRLVEDDQILNGDGTGENLEGILEVDGIQSYSQSSGPNTDNKADAIRRAATKAMLAYYEPTGVVVHDEDWEDMELLKDDNGQYLLAVSIALGGEPRVWRMPVVSTPAIASGTGLVGAFGIGAQLYDREEATVRIAEQHSDFFIRNAVVVLVEERLALATKRPEAFVEVTFA